jgi:hypothetical protein
VFSSSLSPQNVRWEDIPCYYHGKLYNFQDAQRQNQPKPESAARKSACAMMMISAGHDWQLPMGHGYWLPRTLEQGLVEDGNGILEGRIYNLNELIAPSWGYSFCLLGFQVFFVTVTKIDLAVLPNRHLPLCRQTGRTVPKKFCPLH